jgi:hypothetical protein
VVPVSGLERLLKNTEASQAGRCNEFIERCYNAVHTLPREFMSNKK